MLKEPPPTYRHDFAPPHKASVVAKWALFCAPRGLSLAFAAFLSVFALDVFAEGLGAWSTLLALAVYLFPAGLIALAFLAAWRRAGVGFVLFTALGVAVLLISQGQGWAIAGLLLLIGLLFLADGLWGRP